MGSHKSKESISTASPPLPVLYDSTLHLVVSIAYDYHLTIVIEDFTNAIKITSRPLMNVISSTFHPITPLSSSYSPLTSALNTPLMSNTSWTYSVSYKVPILQSSNGAQSFTWSYLPWDFQNYIDHSLYIIQIKSYSDVLICVLPSTSPCGVSKS